MSETRSIICEGGSEVLGQLTFPNGTSEEVWRAALSGYACPKHPPLELELSLDERLLKLEGRIDSAVVDIDILKRRPR